MVVLVARYAQGPFGWGPQALEVEVSFSQVGLAGCALLCLRQACIQLQSQARSKGKLGLQPANSFTCASARALVTRGLRPLINPPLRLQFRSKAP